MKSLKFLAVALTAAMLVTPATAGNINRKGSSAFVGWFGTWYVSKTTFEDGSRVCFAHNLNHGRDLPRLSILSVIGGKDPGPWIQYESRFLFPPNATVDLKIGEYALQMQNDPDEADTLISPRSEKEAVQIVNALLDAEKSGERFFYVAEKSGKTYKFSTSETAKVVGYLERNCEFKH